MSAAVLQGVPVTTFDTDLWMDLPPRSYMRILNLCQGLEAEIMANTVVALKDGSLINFLYHVDGLDGFAAEYRRACSIRLHGYRVRVLPLPRLIKSKEAIRRPKDLVHLPYLKQALAVRRQGSKGGR